MKTLKQSKTTGRILSCVSSKSRETCSCITETVSGKKVEQSNYIVRCETPSEEYTVEKRDESGLLESYTVNLWNNTCECDGYENGYYCRHLRLVTALRGKGKIK